jgi:hypothetical protein
MAEPAGVEKVVEVRVVALCGESLLIEGLEASLKDHAGVEIVVVDSSQPGTFQVLDKLSPDGIIFDLTPNQFSCVFAYLRTRRDLVLIGLDIEHDQALVLSGEWRRFPTVADLMQVIEKCIQLEKYRRP